MSRTKIQKTKEEEGEEKWEMGKEVFIKNEHFTFNNFNNSSNTRRWSMVMA